MINFKMKILNYNPSGSYSVEYIPENEKCTTMKLDILINPVKINSKDQVLELLRNSSPQEYWLRELENTDVDLRLLNSIVNTEHIVTDTRLSSVTGFSSHAIMYDQFNNHLEDNDTDVNLIQVAENYVQRSFSATPGEVTTPDQQERLKLKLIIQEVLMEMAGATV